MKCLLLNDRFDIATATTFHLCFQPIGFIHPDPAIFLPERKQVRQQGRVNVSSCFEAKTTIQ
jgi:hypothetical protein